MQRPDDLLLRGRQGKSLTVLGDHLHLTKEGMFSGARDKTIPIAQITSVEVKKPGAFAGFIQFSLGGSRARDSSYTFSGGAVGAAQDENSVLFNGRDNYEMALKIKAYVEEWLAGVHNSPVRALNAQPSIADQVRELKALVDEGLITPEQFEAKKRDLLGI